MSNHHMINTSTPLCTQAPTVKDLLLLTSKQQTHPRTSGARLLSKRRTTNFLSDGYHADLSTRGKEGALPLPRKLGQGGEDGSPQGIFQRSLPAEDLRFPAIVSDCTRTLAVPFTGDQDPGSPTARIAATSSTGPYRLHVAPPPLGSKRPAARASAYATATAATGAAAAALHKGLTGGGRGGGGGGGGETEASGSAAKAASAAAAAKAAAIDQGCRPLKWRSEGTLLPPAPELLKHRLDIDLIFADAQIVDGSHLDQEIVEAGLSRRDFYECLFRYNWYVNEGVEDSCVAPYNQRWTENIEKLVDLRSCAAQFGEESVQARIAEMREEVYQSYVEAWKRAMVDHILSDPNARLRTGISFLPRPILPRGGPPLQSGWQLLEELRARSNGDDIGEDGPPLFPTAWDIDIPAFSSCTLQLLELWYSKYSDLLLVNLPEINSGLVSIDSFCDNQTAHCAEVRRLLETEWLEKAAMVMAGQSSGGSPRPNSGDSSAKSPPLWVAPDAPFKAASALLSTQLRMVVDRSLQAYVDFFGRFDGHVSSTQAGAQWVAEEHTDAFLKVGLTTFRGSIIFSTALEVLEEKLLAVFHTVLHSLRHLKLPTCAGQRPQSAGGNANSPSPSPESLAANNNNANNISSSSNNIHGSSIASHNNSGTLNGVNNSPDGSPRGAGVANNNINNINNSSNTHNNSNNNNNNNNACASCHDNASDAAKGRSVGGTPEDPRSNASHSPEEGVYLETGHLWTVSIDENHVKEAEEFVKRVIRKNLEHVQQSLSLYDEYAYLLHEETRVRQLADNLSMTREDYMAQVEHLQATERAIREKCSNEIRLQMICLDCQEINDTLCRKASEAVKLLLQSVLRNIMLKNDKLVKNFETVVNHMVKKPACEMELVDLEGHVEDLRAYGLRDLFNDFTSVRAWLAFLFECENRLYWTLLNHTHFQKIYDSAVWVHQIDQIVSDREANLRREREALESKFKEQRNKFLEDLEGYCISVDRFKDNANLRAVDDYLERIQALKKLFARAHVEAENMNNKEIRLGWQPSTFDKLKTGEKDLEPYLWIWTLAFSIDKATKQWQKGPLFQLNPEKVETDVYSMLQEARRLKDIFQDLGQQTQIAVATQLEGQLQVMVTSHLKLIQALCNPTLQPRHWEQTSRIVGFPIEPDHTWTLSRLLDLEAGKHVAGLQAISIAATKEHGVERVLDSLAADWEPLKLETIPWPQMGTEIFSMVSLEETKELIEVHLAKTRALRNSPHVTPWFDRVAEWERWLTSTGLVLDHWQHLQRLWLYLSPIFAHHDLMRQMPAEAQLLRSVDETWRRIMHNASEQSSALQVTSDPGLLSRILDCETKLEQVQHGLGDYLETKRLSFPKFNFVADCTLLDMLVDIRDQAKAQLHLRRVFPGIERLQQKPPAKGSAAAPNEARPCDAMISSFGEVVYFEEEIDDSSMFDLSAEDWYKEVEHGMTVALRKNCFEALGKTLKCSEWLTRFPMQTLLLTQAAFFTLAVTRALRTEGLTGTKQHEEDRLVELVTLARGQVAEGLQRFSRYSLENWIMKTIHQATVVSHLLEAQVDNEDDFEWLKEMRVTVEEYETAGVCGGDIVRDCFLNIAFARLQCEFEYHGNGPRLVLTASTERAYFSLAAAIHRNFNNLLVGAAGSGRTTLTRDLAQTVGKSCFVVDCQESFDLSTVFILFKGCASAGIWCCFDDVDRVKTEVLSVMAQHLLAVIQALIRDASHFELDGMTLRVNKCFITATSAAILPADGLLNSFRSLFRTLALPQPNLQAIAYVKLLAAGFRDAQALAARVNICFKSGQNDLKNADVCAVRHGLQAISIARTHLFEAGRRQQDIEESAIVASALLQIGRNTQSPRLQQQFLALVEAAFGRSDILPRWTSCAEDDRQEEMILQTALEEYLQGQGIKAFGPVLEKTLQLIEVMKIHRPLILLGSPFGGKTTSLQALAAVLKEARGELPEVQLISFSPAVLDQTALLGARLGAHKTWNDGLVSGVIRDLSQSMTAAAVEAGDDYSPAEGLPCRSCTWLHLDADPDDEWMLPMSSLLEEGQKYLHLSSGETLTCPESWLQVAVEAGTAAKLSPSSVGRCSIMHYSTESIGSDTLVTSWFGPQSTLPLRPEQQQMVSMTWQWLVEPILNWSQGNLSGTSYKSSQLGPYRLTLTQGILQIMNLILTLSGSSPSARDDDSPHQPNFVGVTLTAVTTGLGVLDVPWTSRSNFANALRSYLSQTPPAVLAAQASAAALPESGSIFDFWWNDAAGSWQRWTDLEASPNSRLPLEGVTPSLFLPTTETSRCLALLSAASNQQSNAMIYGRLGSGKSTVLSEFYARLDHSRYRGLKLCCSSRTGSTEVRSLLESSIERRDRDRYGPENGLSLAICLDDLSLPALETKASNNTLEFLRQLCSYKSWRDNGNSGRHFRYLLDSFAVGSCSVVAGLPQAPLRLLRHFIPLILSPLDGTDLKNVLAHRIPNEFAGVDLANRLAAATVEVHTRLASAPPLPGHPQERLSTQEAMRVVAGLNLASENDNYTMQVAKLWAHECIRTYGDRCGVEERRGKVIDLVKWAASTHILVVTPQASGPGTAISQSSSATSIAAGSTFQLASQVSPSPVSSAAFVPLTLSSSRPLFASPLLWGRPAPGDGAVEELNNIDDVQTTLSQAIRSHVEDYPELQEILLFPDPVLHVLRITRSLGIPARSILLLGLPQQGRHTAAKLATLAVGIRYLHLSRNKEHSEGRWRELLKEASLGAAREERLALLVEEVQGPGFATPFADAHDVLTVGGLSSWWEKDKDGREVLEIVQNLSGGLWDHSLTSGSSRNNSSASGTTAAQTGANTSHQSSNNNNNSNANNNSSSGGGGSRQQNGSVNTSATQNDGVRLDSADAAELPNKVGHTDWASTHARFAESVKQHLHMILCPSGGPTRLQRIFRRFPALLRCVDVDWYGELPVEAHLEVAERVLEATGLEAERQQIQLCHSLHVIACQHGHTLMAEVKRSYHVTMNCYLEFVRTYSSVLKSLRAHCASVRHKYLGGLRGFQLIEASLTTMETGLSNAGIAIEKLNESLEEARHHRSSAEAVAREARDKSEEAEGHVSEKRKELASIRQEVTQEVRQAQQAVSDTMSHIENECTATGGGADFLEIRNMRNPTNTIKKVMEMLCIMKGQKVLRIRADSSDPGAGTMTPEQWSTTQKMVSESGFLASLQSFDPDRISLDAMKKVNRLLADDDCEPTKVQRASKLILAILNWIKAIVQFREAQKNTIPKREVMANLEATCGELSAIAKDTQAVLAEKEALLLEATHVVESLEAQIAHSANAKIQLAHNLEKGKKLVASLGDGHDVWAQRVVEEDEALECASGNALLAAGTVTHLGVFPSAHRQRLLEEWQETLRGNSQHTNGQRVLFDPDFSLLKLFKSRLDVPRWLRAGLPGSSHALENASIISLAYRWPLCIDPQGHASSWIRSVEADHSLFVISASKPEYWRDVEKARGHGRLILVEDLESHLHPVLRHILAERFVCSNQASNFGSPKDDGSSVKDEPRFYMSTRRSSCRLSGEICSLVTLVDFSISLDGLTAQLFGMMVRKLDPETASLERGLLVEVATREAEATTLESKLLDLLSYDAAGGGGTSPTLEDSSYLDALITSHEQLDEALSQKRKAESWKPTRTEAELAAWNERQAISTAGATFLMSVLRLHSLSPVYHFSLERLETTWVQAILEAEKQEQLNFGQRVRIGCYCICRVAQPALFAKHRLTLAVSLAAAAAMARFPPEDSAGDMKAEASMMQHPLQSKPETHQQQQQRQLRETRQGSKQGTAIAPAATATAATAATTAAAGARAPTAVANVIAGVAGVPNIEGAGGPALGDEEVTFAEFQVYLACCHAASTAAQTDTKDLRRDENLRESMVDCLATLPVFYDLKYSWRGQGEMWDIFVQETKECLKSRQQQHLTPTGYADLQASLPTPPDPFEDISLFQSVLLHLAVGSPAAILLLNAWVAKVLGPDILDPVTLDLRRAFARTSASTFQVILLTAPGSDPLGVLSQLADYTQQEFCTIAIGPRANLQRAEAVVLESSKTGRWVYLPNVHLEPAWLARLGLMLESKAERHEKHPDFRLWLMADPRGPLPPRLLERSIKVACEAPMGLKASLLTAIQTDPLNDEMFFGGCPQRDIEWKTALYRLLPCHGTIFERAAHGAIGWTLPYDFSSLDLIIVAQHIQDHLATARKPRVKEVLSHLISSCGYGARIEDPDDKRLLDTLISELWDENTTSPMSAWTHVRGTFVMPSIGGDNDVQGLPLFVSNLPRTSSAGLCGLSPVLDEMEYSNSMTDVMLSLDVLYGSFAIASFRGRGSKAASSMAPTSSARSHRSKSPRSTINGNNNNNSPNNNSNNNNHSNNGAERQTPHSPSRSSGGFFTPTKSMKPSPTRLMTPATTNAMVDSKSNAMGETRTLVMGGTRTSMLQRAAADSTQSGVRSRLDSEDSANLQGLRRDFWTTVLATAEKASSTLEDLPPVELDLDASSNPMWILLQHEIFAYGHLRTVIMATLQELLDVCTGNCEPSLQSESTASALLVGEIPPAWLAHSYPTCKAFASYLEDFRARIDFCKRWNQMGRLTTYWISGFFSVRRFLDALQQHFAKERGVTVDALLLKAKPKKRELVLDGKSVVCGTGLYLEGARWCESDITLDECEDSVRSVCPPILLFGQLSSDSSSGSNNNNNEEEKEEKEGKDKDDQNEDDDEEDQADDDDDDADDDEEEDNGQPRRRRRRTRRRVSSHQEATAIKRSVTSTTLGRPPAEVRTRPERSGRQLEARAVIQAVSGSLRRAGSLEDEEDNHYSCPVYLLPTRSLSGSLLYLSFPTSKAPKHWVARGVAALCQLDS